MKSLNQHIFLLLNADAQASVFSIWVDRALAEWPVLIALLFVGLAWYRHNTRKLFAQRTIVATALAVGMALIIRCTYYNPRPLCWALAAC